MTITDSLFEAFLKCPTKCWLWATNEQPSGNTYAEWVKAQNESYRIAATEHLRAQFPSDDCALSPRVENIKTAKWRLAADVAVAAAAEPAPSILAVETRLHAIERVPAEGRGKANQFIPIRFIFFNKLNKSDRLLLAFDAFVLSTALGREIVLGKITHGDDQTTLKVKVSALAGALRKGLSKITALLSSQTPPDLVLNRHCAECEFQARCRKIAIEKDDLSLMARMSEKERKLFHNKGIFTIRQLSYTFRPRRRPRALIGQKEKYHHALKALAIREGKIHVAGRPALIINGTPVYLDVEGVPDREFYYLIGVRIETEEGIVQHSLWANTQEEEGIRWRELLSILANITNPVLIHYGSYEQIFLKKMAKRYADPENKGSNSGKLFDSLNVLSHVRSSVYFSRVLQ